MAFLGPRIELGSKKPDSGFGYGFFVVVRGDVGKRSVQLKPTKGGSLLNSDKRASLP
jgi:hypothetical protein